MGINIRAKLSFSKYFYANFKMNLKQIEKCNIIHLKKTGEKQKRKIIESIYKKLYTF